MNDQPTVRAEAPSRTAKVFGPVAFSTLLALSLGLWALARSAREHGVLAPPGRPIGEFTLVDQRGAAFGSADVAGKVWVASFFRTSCDATCPMLMSRLARYAAFSRDRTPPGTVAIVSVSVDPAHDDPARLAAWARKWAAQGQSWTFATAAVADLERTLVRDFFPVAPGAAARTAEDAMGVDRVVLVDRAGRVRGTFEDTRAGFDALERATLAVLNESSK